MWQGIAGHDEVVAQFRRALARGRLASSFLFMGPMGVGKRTFALALARALSCERGDATLEPCNRCDSCVQAAAGTHPDIDLVAKADDKAFIPVDAFIGDKEHRRRVGLCHNISLRPFFKRKVAIIDDADHLNAEGANALLKTLEEPPPRSVLILVGTSPARQLPTIRSRCQVVSFGSLPAETVEQLLIERDLVSDRAMAHRLAEYSGGSVGRALELMDTDLWEFRDVLRAALGASRFDSVGLAPQVSKFVDLAGKEAPPRRARLRQVIAFAADFYREQLHAVGQEPPGDPRADAIDATARRLDRCLEAAEQIDRNAHQATLIEAWLDGLN